MRMKSTGDSQFNILVLKDLRSLFLQRLDDSEKKYSDSTGNL